MGYSPRGLAAPPLPTSRTAPADSCSPLHGVNYRGSLVCFGKAVMSKEPFFRQRSKLEARFLPGVFLGKSEVSDEYVISRAMARLCWLAVCADARPQKPMSLGCFQAVGALPWSFRGGAVKDLPSLAATVPIEAPTEAEEKKEQDEQTSEAYRRTLSSSSSSPGRVSLEVFSWRRSREAWRRVRYKCLAGNAGS